MSSKIDKIVKKAGNHGQDFEKYVSLLKTSLFQETISRDGFFFEKS
jgi:hypothetical protein